MGVRGVHTAAKRTVAYVTPPAPMLASSTSCAPAYMTLKSLQDNPSVAFAPLSRSVTGILTRFGEYLNSDCPNQDGKLTELGFQGP